MKIYVKVFPMVESSKIIDLEEIIKEFPEDYHMDEETINIFYNADRIVFTCYLRPINPDKYNSGDFKAV